MSCGKTSGKPVWREQDVDIVRCGGCGLVYTNLEGDVAETFWKEPKPEKLDQEDFYWDTARAAVYDEVLDLLEPEKRAEGGEPARILDIGCGKGFFLKRAADRGWEAHGLELSPHAVKFAKEKLGLRHVAMGRVENVAFRARMFRVITLWDVIEHLADPGPILRKSAELLAEDGLLFIQTPNIGFHLPYAHLKRLVGRVTNSRKARKHQLEAKHHLVQFTRESLAGMLRRSAFKDVTFQVLRPIESVAGSRSERLAAAKGAYVSVARRIFGATGGRVMLANTLHAFARRGDVPPPKPFKAPR
ncbi:MAG: class I SAM-dependent methyltransferase [Deltaproteobacteria bacterium]|nr:class I SAM-dependent methyltransferase [Deltaproteobacteria bacterium]